MAKSKLTKPTVSLSRDGYKFVLSFSDMDSDADYIYIDRVVYERQDLVMSPNNSPDIGNAKIGAKRNSSWSFTLDKDKYYPFVSGGESDLNQRVAKVTFFVHIEGWHTYQVTVKKKKKKGNKWVTVKEKEDRRVWLSSDTVQKEYKFAPAKKPSVGLVYNQDGATFNFNVDINDDFGIDDNHKAVATRAWAWLKSQVKGEKVKNVSGYTGKWYNRDSTPNITNKIAETISPDIPKKFIGYAYAAGPGGKSEVVTAEHIFAKPKAPAAPTIVRSNVLQKSEVDNGYGIYQVSWNINTGGGWYPVDNVTIEYRDQDDYKGDSDIYGEQMGTWSEAKGNINSSIQSIQTNELGAVADDKVRYFRIKAEHDGNVTPGYVSGIVAYGKPSNVSNFTVSTPQDYGKEALLFKWSEPASKLQGTNPNSKLYNGGVLGEGGRLRILIFKNTTSSTPIKTIYYRKGEWEDHEWVYEIPEEDLDKPIDYCVQVRVGLDNLDPGGKSDNLWLYNIIVPAKCKNVKGTRLANNTAVELTWDNPEKDDTVRNGIEVAWSTFPHAWESNSTPSTAKFANGAMTKAYITGLTAGEYYYFWVRRYEELNDGSINYSLWSDTSPGVLLADKPDIPILTLSRSWIKEGGNLSAQWVYYASGNLPQLSAQIEISKDKSTWTPIASVVGEEDRCTIDMSNKINSSYEYLSGDYYLKAIVKNSMGSSESEPIAFKIATPPTCTLTSSSIVDYTYDTQNSNTGVTESTTVKSLRSLPLSVNVNGDGELNLYVYCIDNYEKERPGGIDNLYEGDCIWTSSVKEGDYTINKISLIDGGRYRLQLECIDPDTLLTADPQFIDFEVHWKRTAIAPNGSTVTINEDGTATLVPVKPEGALDTDVCDIYRTTADGRYLCYKGASWGASIIDELPTFGETMETSYCFCTRTPDGDEAWCDIPYELYGSGIIINYVYGVLKLPWNVTIGDNRSKQGEIRSHLGGSKLYYGQPYIERSQSLSTEVVKIENEDLINKLYDLSRYSNLCYVRTSNCIGYPAIVDVSINRDYNNEIVSVSLSAKEADANNEFLGKIPE